MNLGPTALTFNNFWPNLFPAGGKILFPTLEVNKENVEAIKSEGRKRSNNELNVRSRQPFCGSK